MSHQVKVFVLCEDKQSGTLIRQYLHRKGFSPRAIRVHAPPAGVGCGSQWVREHYAGAVRVNRTRHVAEVLLVHIDADNHTVAERHSELDRALATSGQSPRTKQDPIALVVPCWETETWLHHFLGHPGIHEGHRGYPKFTDDKYTAAKPTAEALLACLRGAAAPPPNLPSFATAVAELTRLP